MGSMLYCGLFIISCIYLFVLLLGFKKHLSEKFILLSVAIICVNFGFWQLSLSQTIEAALVVNRMIYLGACASGYLMLECIADLCKVKVPWLMRILCICLGVVTLWGIFSTGENGYYYKEVSLTTSGGVTILEKVYGPLHIIYPIFQLVVLLYGMYIIIRSFLQRRKVSYITSSVCFAAMMVTSMTYFGERVLNVQIELLPVAYVVSFLGVILILTRVVLYDVKGISRVAMDESLEYGCVICDVRGRFEEADKTAREWFPELNSLNIDYVIKNADTDFLKLIKQWVDNERYDSKTYIERNNRIIEIHHTQLIGIANKRIHCITMRDDTRQQKHLQLVENYNENLENVIDEKTKNLRAIQSDIIISMASIVENRDGNTGGHIRRSSDVVKIFTKHLYEINYGGNFRKEFGKRVTRAASLHDFGKIAIPDIILNKPGKFTDEEFEQMKQHSAKGAVIVEQILQNVEDLEFKEIAINVAHYHHERWDGHGYPSGLGGEDIPFEARIMALADVFDALVSKRVYKEQMSYDKAFSIITQSCGNQFDPKLCKEFLNCRELLEELYDSYED